MRRVLAIGVVASFAAGCPHETRVEPQLRGGPGSPDGRADGGVSAVGATPGTGAEVPPAPHPVKVKIVVRSTPKAAVSWGKKKLGVTPLSMERPRDSGPIDLVLRASGYFPVHSRAYTVKNDTISVRMTRHEDRMSVFGAKAELPPEGDPAAPATGDPLDPANLQRAPTPPGTPTPAPTLPPAPPTVP